MEKTILVDIPVESLCEDDTLDFNEFVHTYGDFIIRIAYAVVRNPEDAEDVAQETFFRAFRNGNLGKIENMKAWLGRIAWRLALNRSRSRSRDKKNIHTDDLARTLPSRETGPEELLVRKERIDLLGNVLGTLPKNLRETFVLLTVREMTSRTAAKILGIPEATVRNRLFRARGLIKQKLAALMEDGNEA